MIYCFECKRKIKPYDVWHLYDNSLFYDRKLFIGKCPKCKKDFAALIEVRKTDNKIFLDTRKDDKASKLIDKCITQIWYRNKDLKFKKGVPFGFIFGENRQNKKEINVYACDFFGNKQLIESKAI